MNFQKRESWLYRDKSNTFSVEILKWSYNTDYSFPESFTWNIYAYIYPKHALFTKIEQDKALFCDTGLPFHGGITFNVWSYDSNGIVFCKKVGCDYNHCGDEKFINMVTEKDAHEIFEDAEKIIKFLKETK